MNHFDRKLAREVAGIFKDLAAACDRVRRDDPESLHVLRIAIRRSRAVLISLRQLPGFVSLRKPLGKFKQVATKTNALRDREVQLELIADLAPQPEADLSAWCLEQEQQQAKAMSRLERMVAQKSLTHAAKRLERKFHRAVKSAQGAALFDRLRQRELSIQNRLAQTLGTEHDVLDDSLQWHAVRLDCKKLRYMLEACPAAYPCAVLELIPAARAAQSALGRLRDIGLLKETLHENGLACPELRGSLGMEQGRRRRLASQSIAALSQCLLRVSAASAEPL